MIPRRALRPPTDHPRRARTPWNNAAPSTRPAPPAGRRVFGVRRFEGMSRPPPKLPNLVVGSFLRDGEVVRVALAEPCLGDADEAGLGTQLFDGGDAAVAHAGPETAHELIDHVRDLPLVGNARLDSFGHELLQILHAFLEVAVASPARHGAEGS